MIDLDALMKLHDETTPGPWEHRMDTAFMEPDSHEICTTEGHDFIAGFVEPHDAAYIVAACNAVPALVERIRELEAKLTAAGVEVASENV